MPSPPDPAPRPRPTTARNYLAEEEARRQLTAANVHLRRGQTAEAERVVQDALAKNPDDAEALELLGDIRLASGAFDEAGAAYRAALAKEPGRATAESKLARVTLRQSETHRKETLGVAYAASGVSLMRSGGEDDPKRRTRLALLSALLPGLGQLFGGEFVKGGVIALLYILGWLVFSLTADRSSFGRLHGLPLVVVVLLTLDWLYAVVDAAVLSGPKHSNH